MTVFAAATLALRTLYRRLLEQAGHPETLLAGAIAGLEGAGRELRTHLAELTLALGRTERRLGAAGEDALHAELAAQAESLAERLGHLRLQLADLDGKVLQLKAVQADLRLKRDLRLVRERLGHILGDLVACEEDPLAEVAGALSYHQELRATLTQLKHGGLLR